MQFGGEFGFYDSVLYESDLFNGECNPILGGAPVYQEKANYIGFFSYVGGVNTLHMLGEVLLI